MPRFSRHNVPTIFKVIIQSFFGILDAPARSRSFASLWMTSVEVIGGGLVVGEAFDVVYDQDRGGSAGGFDLEA
jgi:hypothetical protein